MSGNGEITYSYRNIKPAWRVDVCIAKYGIMDNNGKSPRLFFLPEHKETAHRIFNALLASTELLSKWFGARSNHEGFSVIEVPKGYGSQADFTCILQDAEAFEGDLHYIYHEVSHLWNPLPLDPAPSRFESEGLACFLEYLLKEKLESKPGSLQEAMKDYRKRFRAQCKQKPPLKTVPIAHYGVNDCTEASYTKGPIAFWILYKILGEELFIDIYKQFCLEYGNKGATLEDFVKSIKTTSGKDLQKYFDEWVYGAQSSKYLLGNLSLQRIVQLYVDEHQNPVDDAALRN